MKIRVCVLEHYCPVERKRIRISELLTTEEAMERARTLHQVEIWYKTISVLEVDPSWSKLQL